MKAVLAFFAAAVLVGCPDKDSAGGAASNAPKATAAASAASPTQPAATASANREEGGW